MQNRDEERRKKEKERMIRKSKGLRRIDKKEIKKYFDDKLKELGINRILGSGNECPKCKKQGNFGSIIKARLNKDWFLICGWCGKISKKKNV